MEASPRDAGDGNTPTLHPFAVDAASLHALVGERSEALLAVEAKETRLTLRLPTVDHGPQPSSVIAPAESDIGTSANDAVPGPHAESDSSVVPDTPVDAAPAAAAVATATEDAAPAGKNGMALAAWTVPALWFKPADTIDLLDALTEAPDRDPYIAASMRYWRRAAQVTLHLLANCRFVPDILEDLDHSHRAVWRPVLHDADTAKAVAGLIAAMPPICRAIDGVDDRSLKSASLVEDFLQCTIDAVVRESLAEDDLVQSIRQRDERDLPPDVAWLRGLTSNAPGLTIASDDRHLLARRVRLWAGQLEETAGHVRFKTCLRLEEPFDDDDQAEANGDKPPWRLTFHLQAADDPSVVLSADRLRTTHGGGVGLMRRQHDSLREQLEADIQKAAGLFPPIQQMLGETFPTECRLDAEQAYEFLRNSAPLLKLNGFAAQLPGWWTDKQSKLGLALDLQPAQSSDESETRLGLESLVRFQWRISLGGEELSQDEFTRIVGQGESLLQVRGKWMEIRPESIRAAQRFLENNPSGETTFFNALRFASLDAGKTGLPVTGIHGRGWIEAALDGTRSEKQLYQEVPQPEDFEGELRPYQRRGVSWMAFLDRFGLGGCLADDMGLGKTIQLIALLLHERKISDRVGPTLLVVPTSLVGNWHRELSRFSPKLRTMIHHGIERLSGDAFVERVDKMDTVISTYALVHRDFEHMGRVKWHRVVLDEAQKIKNPSTKQTGAIRRLQAARRLALTGTPMENHLSELWSISEFLNPGLLGAASEFRRQFAVPVEKHHDEQRAAQLRRIVGPFILRRTKSEPGVMDDLPDKMEMKVFCNLTREQAAVYQSTLDELMGRIDGAVGVQRRGLVLAALTRLKQICNHPVREIAKGDEDVRLAGRSGKGERLVEMLDETLAEGERALVFTQYRQMGKILEADLRARLNREILFLHGGTPQKSRNDLVDRFQSDDPACPVFILSLKAGGFGLNLTSASHVFHYDRWWNPAVEDQASDRAHRIGQTRIVQIHKFVCLGTLEERIDQMLESKRDLADRILGSGEQWLTELSTDKLREVLALSDEAVSDE